MAKNLIDAWKFKSEKGRQTWFFDKTLAAEISGGKDENTWLAELDKQFIFDKKGNPNASDVILRKKYSSNTYTETPKSADEALKRGISYFATLQQVDGNWAGDYGGPLFLLPGLIFVLYATDAMPSPEKKILMKRYILNHQNNDGGWGLHIEGQSTMFGTGLNYVALLLLGHAEDEESAKKALSWIVNHGGLCSMPPWGKFYLAIIGLYDWKGLDALLPEMWLLPKWLPFYPGNYWNHARMVYLPMSYLSGKRFHCEENEQILFLREHLYQGKYKQISWKKNRRMCCEKDDYYPETKFYRFASFFINAFNNLHLPSLRKKALKKIFFRIQAEDQHTHFINLGPVNKVLNTLVNFCEEGKSPNFLKHLERIDDYLWLSEDGLKMNGYNGSQFWDTVFFAHALLEKSKLNEDEVKILNKIENYLSLSLIKNNMPNSNKTDRMICKGGWPFSTGEQSWPITDCSAEGLKAIVLLRKKGLLQNVQLLDELKNTVDLLLAYQCKDGGWASYEKRRAPKWLEKMNPSRIFGEIMVDYSYVECTSACIQGLSAFLDIDTDYRNAEIRKAIQLGVEFIRKSQNENGLWYGLWAVCYTNATWFAFETLCKIEKLQYNKSVKNNPITRACDALVALQNEDGSWGESYMSCVEKRYVKHEEGQVVNTAWAILSLLRANYTQHEIIEKGIQFLLRKQQLNGDWPQQAIMGVFNHNCMISYTNYRNIFPIWALVRSLQYQI
jgi:lanosterol synthase